MCGIGPVVQKSGRRNRHNVKKTVIKSPHIRAYSGILVGLSGMLNPVNFFRFLTCSAYYPTPEVKLCITIND